MASPAYQYTGNTLLGYPDYVDEETERMLLAEPGGVYAMRSVEGIHPVPPADGLWETPVKAKAAAKAEGENSNG